MKRLILSLSATMAFVAVAEVRLAPIFSDGAVLQAHRPVPVWGKADPGQKLAVSFAGQTKKTVSKADGSWSVTLSPMDYSDRGRVLTVVSQTGRGSRASVSDLLVGEVWLGIGQSNMEFPLDYCDSGKVIAKGGAVPETVRFFHLPKDGAEKPRDAFAVPEGTRWLSYTAANEQKAKRSSMLLGLFAQRLSSELKVPIGVIGAGVGGANLETWMSAEAIEEAGTVADAARLLKMCEGWYANDIKKWENRPENEKNRPYPKVNYESRPTQVWNALVPPLAPYAVAGVLWYQGEMNSGWEKYEKQFPFFVKHLRAAFGTTDQPLYIVQLPDFKENHWVRIRDVQRKMSETIPHAGLAVTIDGNEIDLHPKNKTKVVDRLARLALADCYGKKLIARSPAPVKAVAKGGVVRVGFKNADGGLKLTEGDAPRTFELVAGGDKGMPVPAKLVGKNVVELTVPEGMNPTRVRYAWASDPDVNLANGGDLPATPFEIEISRE